MVLESISRTWDEIAEKSGQQTYDYVDQITTAARDFTCNLWKKFPNKMLGPVGLGSKFTIGYLNQACRDVVELPKVTEPPFIGGQCAFKYSVKIDAGVYPSTVNCDRPNDPISNFSFGVWGPISDISLTNQVGSCGGYSTLQLTAHGSSSETRTQVAETFIVSSFSYGRFADIKSIKITPADGQPDDCGNPGVGYPPDPEPTTEDLNDTYIFNDYGGNTINVPVGLAVFDNDINLSLEAPIELNIGGTNVSVDLGGITINRKPVGNRGQDDKDRLPNKEKHPLPNPVEEDVEEPEDVEKEIKTVKRNTSDSGVYQIEGELIHVKIVITQTPINTSSRYGGVAPDVQYTGWFEWIEKGFKHPRSLIQFDANIFYPPLNATAYAYTLYKGALGYSIETYLVEVLK